jgi:phosphoglycerate kinase
MKYIDQLSKEDLAGKRVFIRSDLNVPIAEDLTVADETRIVASLPTIKYALEAGAKVILASHLGRPKGKPSVKFSLGPVAERLKEHLGTTVVMADDCVGAEVEDDAAKLREGEVLLLENVRFHEGETNNDPGFAAQLAALADVYINDAFATAHRAHASTAAITEHFEVKAGGFVLKKELEYFAKAFDNPERPVAAIFGGAKVSTKMDAIRNVAKKVDLILIGGAMANTFFAAEGYPVGTSLYEADQVDNAKSIKAELSEKQCELVLPVDVVVAEKLESGQETSVHAIDDIPPGKMALDIGPKSMELFKEKLAQAKTIVWNGPMGAFETKEFAAGTYAMVDVLVESPALTVVGGGDTDRALHDKHAIEKMDYVSTAGGAFLELLEGKTLPGVTALG